MENQQEIDSLVSLINKARRAKSVAQTWPERNALQADIDRMRSELQKLKGDSNRPEKELTSTP
jgi:hypothetical protein